MPNPIVELVENEMAVFRELRLAHPNLFPPNDRLYPIPFFGDIRRAEVITVALNPAHNEFGTDRLWPVGQGNGSLTPAGLTNRLLCYFHLPRISRHNWFNTCEGGLQAAGVSYKRNAAHIDIHPHPTRFAGEMDQAFPEGATILRQHIENTGVGHLSSVLGLCQSVKLVIVVDYTLPGDPGISTFQFVSERLTQFKGLVDPTGSEPPLLKAGGHAAMAAFLLHRQSPLTDFLKSAPALVF